MLKIDKESKKILLDALVEYEEAHWQDYDNKWQARVNAMIKELKQ